MGRTVVQIRNLESLSRKVIVWAWISVGGQVAVSVFSYLEARALSRMVPSEAIGWLDSVLSPDIDLMAGAVSLLMFIVLVTSSVISLRWIYLSNKNAHAVAAGLTVSPGWNVGWFFVPILSLFKPFEGIEQVWRASKAPEGWSTLEIPTHMRWWWAFWLLSTIAGTISARLEIAASTAGARLFSDVADIASTALFIPATILFLRVVREVTEFQAIQAGLPSVSAAMVAV